MDSKEESEDGEDGEEEELIQKQLTEGQLRKLIKNGKLFEWDASTTDTISGGKNDDIYIHKKIPHEVMTEDNEFQD